MRRSGVTNVTKLFYLGYTPWLHLQTNEIKG